MSFACFKEDGNDDSGWMMMTWRLRQMIKKKNLRQWYWKSYSQRTSKNFQGLKKLMKYWTFSITLFSFSSIETFEVHSMLNENGKWEVYDRWMNSWCSNPTNYAHFHIFEMKTFQFTDWMGWQTVSTYQMYGMV